MIISKDYYLFMENKKRNVRMFRNVNEKEIIVVDTNNFYNKNVNAVRNEITADLTTQAVLCGQYDKLNDIEKEYKDIEIVFG